MQQEFMIPVFYINLATRPDRREFMEQQFAQLGMAAERVEAVTPAEMPALTRQRKAALPPAERLSPNEIACSLSHRKAWRMMIERGNPYALFMEDDGVLSASLPAILSDPTLLSPDADAIQFETHRTSALLGRPVPTAMPGLFKHRLMSSSLGGAAYLLTSKFAAELLTDPRIDDVCHDVLIFSREHGFIYNRRIFQMSPALVVQVGHIADPSQGIARSDLTEGRKRRRRGKARTIGRHLSSLGRTLHHLARIAGTFIPTGDLFAARQVRLPIAEDIRAPSPRTSHLPPEALTQVKVDVRKD